MGLRHELIAFALKDANLGNSSGLRFAFEPLFSRRNPKGVKLRVWV